VRGLFFAMRWSLVAVLAILTSLCGPNAFMHGNEPDALDVFRIVAHLQACERRPVFVVASIAPNLKSDVVPPCEKGALATWLAKRQLVLVFEDDLILIKSAQVTYPVASWQDWSHVRLQTVVRSPLPEELQKLRDSESEYRFVPVRRTLAPTELQRVGAWLLKNLAMPPVDLPARCAVCGDAPGVATIHLQIVVESVQLAKNANERIVGRVSAGTFSRIFVGRVQRGEFHLDWISPLLGGASAVLSFRDVDADGVAEIESLSERRDGSDPVWLLSIFDLEGRELTRDAGECDHSQTYFPWSGSTCPIVGFPGVDHFVKKDGTVALEAARDFRNKPEARRVYEIRDGRFVRVE